MSKAFEKGVKLAHQLNYPVTAQMSRMPSMPRIRQPEPTPWHDKPLPYVVGGAALGTGSGMRAAVRRWSDVPEGRLGRAFGRVSGRGALGAGLGAVGYGVKREMGW